MKKNKKTPKIETRDPTELTKFQAQ